MEICTLIKKKRDGGELSAQEIVSFVHETATGGLADYQAAAMLMAMFCRGLSLAETRSLTLAMRDSGAVLRWPAGSLVVDKHSTGGVGDGVSLLAGPIAAALGVRVPMIAGRGLGHSGGTIDKIEAVPGFSVNLPLPRFQELVLENGMALMAQTPEIAPADGVLYALRDVTATVEHKGLIAASILSKKLAEGLDGLVMDVKAGSGAFMPSLQEARELGRLLQVLGNETGVPTTVLISAMDQPLGGAVGNAVETAQAVDILSGGQHPLYADLVELSLVTASRMARLAGLAQSNDEALERAHGALRDGRALAVFRKMVKAQGGDAAMVDDPARLPQARLREKLLSPEDGHVTRLDAGLIGRAAVALGAGRSRRDEPVDPAVGVLLHKKLGDAAGKGECVMELLANDESRLAAGRELCRQALTVAAEPLPALPLLLEELA